MSNKAAIYEYGGDAAGRPDFDLDTLRTVGMHRLAGQFNAAQHHPDGAYGDYSVIVTGNNDRMGQIAVYYDVSNYRDALAWRRCSWTGNWSEVWCYAATATPPQEYDLPLAAGVTGVAKYRKNQFGEETVYGACELTSDIALDSIFATLPAGYRTKYAMSFQAFSGSGGQSSTGTVDVGTNGNLYYRLPHTHSGDIFRFFINFTAA